MATMYVLSDARGDVWRMTLAGRRIATQCGSMHLVQSFPSARAAAAHLDHVALRRRREGYSVMGVSALPDDAIERLTDPFSSYVSWRVCRGHTEITFSNTLPRTIADRVAERLALESPSRVHLLCDHASPGPVLARSLARRVLPGIRTFFFDTWYESVPRQWENTLGDLADLFWALPNLERLLYSGQLRLRRTKHEVLREMHLFGDPLALGALEVLGGCAFPSLERVTLSGCGGVKDDQARALIAALRRIVAPRLGALHIEGIPDIARFLDVFANGRLPKSWTSVRLEGTILDEDHLLDVLRRRASVLASLEALALPLDSEVSLGAISEASRILPNIQDSGEPLDLRTPEDQANDDS